jgi:hypothetical protein
VATEYKLTTKALRSDLAIDIAEAGVERGIWEICYNNMAFPGWSYANPSGNQTWAVSNVPFRNTNNNIVGYYDTSVHLPSGTLTYTITSTAYTPSKTSADETKKVVVTYAGGKYHFTNAIASAGQNPSIKISGQAFTDSYDSRTGPYGSPLQTETMRGDIQCNGPIIFSGQGHVNGSANPGPNYPFSGTPPVTGSYATLSAPISVNPIPESTMDNAEHHNNNSNMTITGNDGTVTPYTGGHALSLSSHVTLTMPGGVYYFTSINITGEPAVVVTGPSVIYVDGGNIVISGQGIINSTGAPASLGIYSTGSDVNLSGQSAYYGTIYAPAASVTLTGQTDLYGAIVCGSSVDTGQASIHFDLALADTANAPPNYRVLSWMEQ